MKTHPISLNWLDQLGRIITDNVKYSFDLLRMTYLCVRASVFHQSQSLRTIFSVVASQVYFTGYQALPLISVLSIASGAAVVLQSSSQFNLLGGGSMVGQLMVMIVVRELGPLLTALIVIARSGTAVASEIGNMKANREIDALETMGIDPLSYIVFPRLIGGVISVVCLSMYFVYFAILSGYVFSKILLNMPLSFYANAISQAITVADVYLLMLKIFFSGSIIFMICCYQGLLVKRGPHEVPQVTTKAVMNCIIYVVGFNLFVTVMSYLNQLMKLGII
jgi:phospholipid/cholesterol/gamma-HCH transport system permease protein